MKKYIGTLGILSCLLVTPLHAESTTEKQEVSKSTIHATANMLAENVCHNLSNLVQKQVSDCYEKTKDDDSKIEQCILADTYVMFGLQHMRENLKASGKTDGTTESPFMQENIYQERFAKNMQLPRFSHLQTKAEQETYFKSGVQAIEDEINKKCKTTDSDIPQ